MKSAEILLFSLSFESASKSNATNTLAKSQSRFTGDKKVLICPSLCIKIQAQKIQEKPTGSDSWWQLQGESRNLPHSHYGAKQASPSYSVEKSFLKPNLTAHLLDDST